MLPENRETLGRVSREMGMSMGGLAEWAGMSAIYVSQASSGRRSMSVKVCLSGGSLGSFAIASPEQVIWAAANLARRVSGVASDVPDTDRYGG